MIKLGVPNKGRLSERSMDILTKAGFKILTKERKLSAFCENFEMEVIFARASDIPSFIEEGIIDLGITGLDLIKEKEAQVEPILELDFGQAELVLAALKNFEKKDLFSKRLRIATCYPRLTKSFCQQQGIQVDLIEMSGAVELAPKLGLADAIVDLTSSGETMRMNDLHPLATLLLTQAYLFGNRQKIQQFQEQVDRIVTALQSVLLAYEKKFLIANVPKSVLNELPNIVPGLSGPTVMSILGREDLCSIQVVITNRQITEVIDGLKRLGATGILVTNIEQIVP